MVSKKAKTRLLVAGAAAAASALAFFLAWKAFRAYDDLHSDDEDPETEAQDLRLPCADDAEIQDLENLMKTTEEKRGSKIVEEEENGFRLEEFDQFIAEEYGEVLADFGTRSNAGGGGSEGLVREFSSMRDVGFDEMSLQDMSEEDGIILGNAHQDSQSQRELGGQSATEFEFDGGDSSCRGMAVGFGSSGMDRVSRKRSEEHRCHEGLGLQIETSKPSDCILESCSAKGNKDFDCGMSADSVQSLKEHSFENLESTESLDSADVDCNGSVGQLLKDGISSSNGVVNKQSDCQREAKVQNSDGLVSNEHVSLKSVVNSEDGSLLNPPFENSNGVNKGSDKFLSDLSEDSRKPDGTRPKSSSGMDCNTLSSQAYEEAFNTSDIATNEHSSALQTGEDLGKEFSAQTELLQTVEETNKSRRAGNVKFEDHGSHLLNLTHMGCDDKSSEQLLEGPRASKLESTMNGGSNKHSEGLHAYDSYLADPSLSPSMRSQVARAKAIAQKLYAAKEAN